MSILTAHWNASGGAHDVTVVAQYKLVMAQSAPSRGY